MADNETDEIRLGCQYGGRYSRRGRRGIRILQHIGHLSPDNTQRNTFKQRGIKTNVTLCFSANQALLAAKAGATYISPFLGRLDDINLDGVELIENIRVIYDNYAFDTEILAASIRSPNHVTQVALAGADVATIPPAVIRKLADHPLTNAGIDGFLKDWKATGQSIL